MASTSREWGLGVGVVGDGFEKPELIVVTESWREND